MDALNGADPHEIALRLVARYDPVGDCMLWVGALMSSGYGTMKVRGFLWGTHRLSYTLFVGPIPEGMTVDHLCYEKRCLNPEHLRLLSNAENASGRRTKRPGH